MTRNLKALGLALVAVFAMSAVVASGAQASTEDPGLISCHSAGGVEVYPCSLHGEQVEGEKHVFTLTTAGGVTHTTECTTATFTGTITGATSTPTIHPEYKSCTSFGLSATVTTTGCNYLFHIGKTLANGTDYDGTTDIECETGKSIVINAGFGECEVKVDAQSGLSTIEGINMANAETVKSDTTVKAAVTGITYTVTKDGPFCPLSGTGTFGNADYKGNTTVIAKEDNGTAGPLAAKIKMGEITP